MRRSTVSLPVLSDGRVLLRSAEHRDLPAMRAVGYRQAWPFLDGLVDAATFRERAIFATRQLAKRQVTWLRSELDARWFDADAASTPAAVRRALAAFLG